LKRLRYLNIVLAAAIVGLIVYRADPGQLWEVLRSTDFRLALAAALLNLPIALLAPVRSFLVFRHLGRAIPLDVLVPATVLGFVAGGLTPAAAGEILRAGPLRSRANVPVEETMAVIVFERVLSMYLLILSTCVLLGVVFLSAAWRLPVIIGGASLLVMPWVAGALFGQRLQEPDSVQGEGRAASLYRYVLGAAGQIRSLLAAPRLLVPWSLVTVAMFALTALQYWLLTKGVGEGITFEEAWMAFGISAFAAVISLLPFGIGVLDGSLAAILNRLGMTLEQGGVVVLLVRATVTLPLVLGAFACYFYLQRTGVDEPKWSAIS
jgi:uncharacterized protein (TIRG00374 family)